MRFSMVTAALLGLLAVSCPRGAAQRSTSDCDVTPLFRARCAGSACHSGESNPGGVDLVSASLEFRLLDVPASYPQLPDCPSTPELLVDTVEPENSLLLKKILGTHACGTRMPKNAPLNEKEVALVECYVRSFATPAEASR